MQRILELDAQPQSVDEPVSPEPGYGFKTEDFELVMGRRQVAALAFLTLVLVVACSGGAYLAGKAISAREVPVQPVIKFEPAPGPSASVALPAPKPSAEAPLFADPNPKAIYIQVGAVEKGVAIVIAEGLRKHALDSFVAPGPSAKTNRVLIGPFADAQAYQKARNVVAEIGLDNFVRRYQPQ